MVVLTTLVGAILLGALVSGDQDVMESNSNVANFRQRRQAG